jgi:decaprenylphospho-beta-D-ribofuranose 2-oxidase
MYREMRVSGWGRVKSGTAMVARPERVRDLHRLFELAGGRQICSRGAGRSYGDCGLNSGGILVDTDRLARILSFNEETGAIAVEPGVTFERLLRVFLPRGWLVPVSPGTGFVTIGGAVANDVHGKNHEHAGSFGQHIVEMDVMTPDGVIYAIGPRRRPEWFRATVGGLGLTGIVTRIVFRMMRVPGPCVLLTRKRVENLEALFASLESAKEAAYSVAWIDALARGKRRGRGVLETADPVAGADPAPRKAGPDIAIDFPNFALNRLSVSAFNAVYFRRVPAAGATAPCHYGDFLYPLDRIGNWNRIYGKRGFHQFQCVIPYAEGFSAISSLLEEIAREGAASFLAVVKRMGPQRTGYLSFPTDGYTLAVDFANRPGTGALHARLAHIVMDHGGRNYLAKDALLSRNDFERMYPDAASFREIAAEMDPGVRMGSDIARRLGIRH